MRTLHVSAAIAIEVPAFEVIRLPPQAVDTRVAGMRSPSNPHPRS